MNNVYYVGSGELTFDIIERIINENLNLELAPEAKLRIQRVLSLIHIYNAGPRYVPAQKHDKEQSSYNRSY